MSSKTCESLSLSDYLSILFSSYIRILEVFHSLFIYLYDISEFIGFPPYMRFALVSIFGTWLRRQYHNLYNSLIYAFDGLRNDGVAYMRICMRVCVSVSVFRHVYLSDPFHLDNHSNCEIFYAFGSTVAYLWRTPNCCIKLESVWK